MNTKRKFRVTNITVIGLAILLIATAFSAYRYVQEVNELEGKVEEQKGELKEKDSVMKHKERELHKLKKDKELLEKYNEELRKKLEAAEKKMKELEELKKRDPVAYTRANALPSRGESKVLKEFYVTATAYTAYCNGCSGKTNWRSIDLRANPDLKVIAVDPTVISLGSKVWVEGYGYAIAADTGGAIKGYKIDVFIPTKYKAYEWGVRKVKIKILE